MLVFWKIYAGTRCMIPYNKWMSFAAFWQKYAARAVCFYNRFKTWGKSIWENGIKTLENIETKYFWSSVCQTKERWTVWTQFEKCHLAVTTGLCYKNLKSRDKSPSTTTLKWFALGNLSVSKENSQITA